METAFDDPEHRESEQLSFDAKQAEATGEGARAKELYRRAADLRLRAAMRVSGRPKSRGTMAIGAVVLFARAGRYDKAIDAAKLLLDDRDALSTESANELERLLSQYQSTISLRPRRNPLLDWRDEVLSEAWKEAS